MTYGAQSGIIMVASGHHLNSPTYHCIDCKSKPPTPRSSPKHTNALCGLSFFQGRPRCLPERDAVVRVIKPLLSALGYLHEQGIIHR